MRLRDGVRGGRLVVNVDDYGFWSREAARRRFVWRAEVVVRMVASAVMFGRVMLMCLGGEVKLVANVEN